MSTRGKDAKTRARRGAAEQPVDAEIRRAAERIGIPAEELVRQRRDREEERLIRDRVGEKLVLACDQLGEQLATLADNAGGGGCGASDANVMDALLTVWRLRWDLGLFPSKVSHAIESDEGEQSAEGGAS